MDCLSFVKKERVIEILQQLVSIPSVNLGFHGGTGEAAVSSHMEKFFYQLGLKYRVQSAAPERNNVIGILPGFSTRNLLLEAHMDTVQTEGMIVDPFEGVVREGRLYGRGACDTKASLAVMMHAVEILHQESIIPPLSVHLAAVVDEEITYKGISAICSDITANRVQYEAAIVGEPTELHPIIAHKGVIRFYIDVHGTAAHSSNPSAGINAVEKMSEVIVFLKSEERHYVAISHPLTGPPTQCITMIQGGIAPNTVPEFCRLTIDRRTVPGEEPMDVWHQMKQRMQEFQQQTSGLRLTVSEPFVLDYALNGSPDQLLVKCIEQSANKYSSSRQIMGASYGTDASKLSRVGVPTVVFGPGSLAQAHTKDEWIEIDEMIKATAVLLDTILSYRGETK